MAERSLPDMRQHQDNVFPRRIHADSRRAVEIESYARDDDAGESQSPVTPNPQSLIPSHSSLLSNFKGKKSSRAEQTPGEGSRQRRRIECPAEAQLYVAVSVPSA